MTDGKPKSTLRKAFSSPAKPVRRRREKLTPVSVRLTADEKAMFKRDAAGQSLSGYLRDCALQVSPDGDSAIMSRQRKPEFARMLSALGHSSLTRDFEALAIAVRNGTHVGSADSEELIVQAYLTIAIIREDLIAVLGLKPD